MKYDCCSQVEAAGDGRGDVQRKEEDEDEVDHSHIRIDGRGKALRGLFALRAILEQQKKKRKKTPGPPCLHVSVKEKVDCSLYVEEFLGWIGWIL